MLNGTRTQNLQTSPLLDKVIGDRAGSTRAIPMADLAYQLAQTPPLSLSGSQAAPLFATEAALRAATIATKVSAWVYNDPDPAKRGIWSWQAGDWVRVLPLPYSVSSLQAAGGTANAIAATSSVPLSDGMIVLLPIATTNTETPVTVTVNSDAPRTVKTLAGGNVVVGALAAGMVVPLYVFGATLRLMADQVTAAVVAAAEAAATRAEQAASTAAAQTTAAIAPITYTIAANEADAPGDGIVPGYGWAVQMETGEVPLGVEDDGTTRIHALGDVAYAEGDDLYDDYAWALKDASHRVALGIRRDGTLDAALAITDDLLTRLSVRRLARREGKVGVSGTTFARGAVSAGLDRVLSTVGGLTRPYLQRTDIASPTYLMDSGAKIVLIPHGGQSLAVGGTTLMGGALNTIPPSPQHCMAFNTGCVGVQSSVLDPATLTDFVSSYETAAAGKSETQGTALTSALHRKDVMNDNPERVYLYRSHGASGKLISQLDKAGGQPPFPNAVAEVQRAVAIAALYGKQIWLPSVLWTQGEGDAYAGTTFAAYRAALVQLRADYNSDFLAVLPGDNGPIAMIMDQLCAPATGGAAGAPALAQLDVCRSVAGFHLSTPKYIFRMDDDVHLRPLDYAVLGEYQAKVWRRIHIDGEAWKPLWPTSVVRTGATVVIDFNVPRPPLVFDTELLPPAPNYGFEYADDAASAQISAVAITGPAQVTLTLSTAPTGANKRIRYAYTGVNLGAGTRSGAWGNLRDCDTDMSFQDPGRLLRNYCVTFEEGIA